MHPTLYRIAFTIARYIVVDCASTPKLQSRARRGSSGVGRGQPNGRTYETPLPIHNQVEQPLPSLGRERDPTSPLLSSRRLRSIPKRSGADGQTSRRPQKQQER